jgi:nucleoside-diphosphate-sugar epimerase
MRILITGGAGYVGSVVTPHLLASGHDVTVLDSLKFGGQALLGCFQFPRFRFIKGDINDPQTVAESLQNQEVIIHLAAIVGYPACRKYPDEARKTNVEGTQAVVSAMTSGQALIHASTGSNYGRLDDVCTEESPLNPVSLYGITKSQAETIAMTAPRATALRFATAYGVSPRLRLDLLINDFVYQASVNKQIIVYERSFRRTFIHVRDMARAFRFAVENIDRMAGQAYNVGHESQNLTKEQIARKIRERVPFYLHFAETGSDLDQRDYEVSYEKVRKLGFETTVTIDEGIDELVRAMEVVEVKNPYMNL